MPMEDILKLNEDLIRKVRVLLTYLLRLCIFFDNDASGSMLSRNICTNLLFLDVFLVIPICPEIPKLISVWISSL